MSRNWIFGVALGVPAILFPSLSWGQAVETGKDAAMSASKKGRFGGAATLGNDLGLGTFVTNDYSDDPYFAQSLRLVPNYGLTDNVLASVDGKVTWEYTAPNSPTNTVGRNVTPSDIRLGLTHRSLYREKLSGINLSGSFRASIPTSPVSRGRGRVTILTGTAGLDRTFIDRLTLVYNLGFTKYVNTSITANEAPEGSQFCGPATVGGGDCPGQVINQNVAIGNTLGASYRFTDRLSASISLLFTTIVKYKVTDDNDPTDNSQVFSSLDQRHTQTWTTGDISANYFVAEHKKIRYSLSGGITSEQLLADPQGNGRFPFFDFETAQYNYTLLYLNGTAAY